ncbi:MAG: histidine kinase dimerization/phosphoacceptor domain -containing protein [bacterium]|nr:histidine kinase dimerization/phosphoacceptor domain -containing protein [bacterium]
MKAAAKKKEYGQAIATAKKMFLYAQELKDTFQMSKALYRQAYYSEILPNLVEANLLYAQAIKYASATDDNELLISLHINKADVERQLGDFFQAQQTVKKGLEYLGKDRDSVAHYKLYNTLGIACNDAGEYANAHKAYSNGLEYAINFKQRTTLLNNMAVNYKEQQNYKEAIRIYNSLLAEKELNQHPETKARIQDNLGYALFKTGDGKALNLLENALAQRLQQGELDGLFASYIHLADFFKHKDRPKALTYAQNAQQIALRAKSPDWQLEALQYIIILKKEPAAESERYFFLKDSIDRATQALRNEYISTKFLTEETDKENLTLKQQNAAQALLTEKEKTQKWAMGGGMVLSLAGLGIFFLVYRRNQKQKKEIEKQKNLIEELQRELHHRLKNNLSFIDFFITLAKGKFPDPAYSQKLDELQNRINSMFEVHTQLFKKEDVTTVNAKTYISALLENVRKAYDRPNVSLEERVENTTLPADTSFPIGLIINEFVTNSYKYAFPNNEKGMISISLVEDRENYYLKLADNGKGLPKDFDIDTLDSFGMETIKLLTVEYKGTFKLDGKNGLKMEISFPKIEYKGA